MLTEIPNFARGNLVRSNSSLILEYKALIPNLMTFRISGLIQTTQHLQQEIADTCKNRQAGEELSFSNPRVLRLHDRISEIKQQVESLCQSHQGTPADLPNPSYVAYQWLRFLSEKQWLLSHLHGLAEFQEILKNLGNKPLSRINPAQVLLEIRNFNYLFRTKQKKQLITVEINESFISAPKETKEYLVQTALGGKNRKSNQPLKEFTKSPEFKKISKMLQTDNHINLITHQGHYFNLEEIFGTLNFHYFGGKLERPRLLWSPRRSKRRLGYYHPESDAITISRSLDSSDTQLLLVEYILYHEMLHKSLGIRETNGRRYAHTGEFKKAEKKFKDYAKAIEMMRIFCK